MTDFLWTFAKVSIGVVGSAVVFIAGRLYERWKPIYFRVSEITIRYAKPNAYGELDYFPIPTNATSAICHLSLLWFNKKADAVGLHEIAIEFRDAHGKPVFRIADFFLGRNLSPTAVNVDLPPHETAKLERDIAIYGNDFDALSKCRSIYLVAYSTETKRKKREWLIEPFDYPLNAERE